MYLNIVVDMAWWARTFKDFPRQLWREMSTDGAADRAPEEEEGGDSAVRAFVAQRRKASALVVAAMTMQSFVLGSSVVVGKVGLEFRV